MNTSLPHPADARLDSEMLHIGQQVEALAHGHADDPADTKEVRRFVGLAWDDMQRMIPSLRDRLATRRRRESPKGERCDGTR